MELTEFAFGQGDQAEALEKMEAGGLRSSYFMPGLARDKEDIFGFARLRDQDTRRPTQVMWG
ncbi:MAG: hypothetical protein OXC28_22290 [Defluviicoccus sp.]|nr:hypothetical protein [Defluviicoccus sp.]